MNRFRIGILVSFARRHCRVIPRLVASELLPLAQLFAGRHPESQLGDNGSLS
jgi:hypothetical protein